MIGFKQRDTKLYIKTIARQKGISVAEVREEMQQSIEMARNNPDPEKQAEFRKIFGDRTPTPEEFVAKMTKKVSKRMKF